MINWMTVNFIYNAVSFIYVSVIFIYIAVSVVYVTVSFTINGITVFLILSAAVY